MLQDREDIVLIDAGRDDKRSASKMTGASPRIDATVGDHMTVDDSLYNVLLNGIIKDVNDAWDRKSCRATLILLYTGIDAMAHLTMPAGKDKVTRADFVAWVEKYLQFRGADKNPTLTLPGIELYAARCALLHTYSSEADLHKEGKVKRQIGYGDEFLPEVAEKAEIKHLVMVSIRGLVDAFARGIAATLQDIKSNEPRSKLFSERLDKMVHELPFTG